MNPDRREQNKNQTLVWKSVSKDEQEQSGAEVHQLCDFPGQGEHVKGEVSTFNFFLTFLTIL